MIQLVVVLAILAIMALTLRYPRGATVLWILAMATSPDTWLENQFGGNELVVGSMKSFGLLLVAVIGLRYGWRRDRYNPAFAFGAMFAAGLAHGLYPGLTLMDSFRSLIGSAGPFLFSFVILPPEMVRSIKRATVWAPSFAIGVAVVLALVGIDSAYTFEQGSLRLGSTGEPPFLAGFALIAVYAGLLELLAKPRPAELAWLGVNFMILLLTGARSPLVLALILALCVLIAQRRFYTLAFTGALACCAVLFMNALSFLRVVNLTHLGEAADLSNRNLVWPYFIAAISASPWVGWGVGAGKVVVPLGSRLANLIGTNAAHDEYLRIGSEGGFLGLLLLVALMLAWLRRGTLRLPRGQARTMALVFAAFALHSATDNTLIATTASVMFLWVSAVFAGEQQILPVMFVRAPA